MLLHDFLKQHSLCLHDPTVDNVPARAFSEWLFVPYTRRPLGAQSGYPAMLDHFAVRHGKLECSVNWKAGIDGDHAAMLGRWELDIAVAKPKQSTHWSCSDVHACTSRMQTWDFSKDSSWEYFLGSMLHFQELYNDKRSCVAKRYQRLPFSLRVAYQCKHKS